MIQVIILFLSLFSNPDLSVVVYEFHKVKTQEEELKFIAKYKSSKDYSIQAYVCALEMKQAEYPFNPYSKLSIFVRSRRKLSGLIEKSPSNVHLRYIRLILQENTPRILAYRTHVEEDKIFLSKVLIKKDETDFLDSYIYKYTSL